ncbi:amiloride-sensitive sodium channel [Desmophyllum pertusum]|uniref:Amiloride-sensitive sodium channel n=1 Tax=Desmophyllum pertusum TaxID=174260 RepID=A0A9X0D5Z4_9CNID|nr:amiloride-sensitive sodium channel [Desmophyllum pertusum]
MEDNYKPNSFKKELAQFFSKTSAHGICQVASSTTKTRALFWVLLTLTAFIVSINNIVGFVNEYLTYPVKTEVDMMHEGSLLFPSVTVCNLNQFQRSRFQNDSTMKMLSEMLFNNSDLSFKSNLATTMRLQKAAAKRNISMESLSHQKDDFIVWCEVRRITKTTCSARNFTTYLGKMDVCFTFNGDNTTLKVRDAGYLSGFSLILNIEADEHLPNPMGGSGVIVAVHQPSESAEVEKTGLTLAPGTLNTITLRGVSSLNASSHLNTPV